MKNNLKIACKIRSKYSKLPDFILMDKNKLEMQMGWVCSDCKINSIPWSGKTCTEILKLKELNKPDE